MVMPNTEVKWLPAFIASFFTSIMFSVFQYAFIYLQVLINTYNKIYGSFPSYSFLIWLRIAWFLIILGAHLSYLLQNRDMNLYYDSLNIDEISFQSKFSLAVHILTEMVIRYQKEESLVTRADFIEKFHNVIAIDGVLRILKKEFYFGGRNEKQEKVYSLAKFGKNKVGRAVFCDFFLWKKLENIENKVVSEKNANSFIGIRGYEERE